MAVKRIPHTVGMYLLPVNGFSYEFVTVFLSDVNFFFHCTSYSDGEMQCTALFAKKDQIDIVRHPTSIFFHANESSCSHFFNDIGGCDYI